MGRKGSIFEDVINMPWPVGVGLAIVCVLALHGYLWLTTEPTAAYGAGQLVRSVVEWFAYGCAFLFLLAAFFSYLTQLIRGKRFNATRSTADIRGLSWKQFESFIGDLFRQEGYFVIETPEGPDNGVDLVLRKEGEKTYVQCKHWKTNQVGVEKVRELLGSMAAGGANAGIFVTSGTYTQPAQNLARECGIRLIDGRELAELIDIDSFAQSGHAGAPQVSDQPACPTCNAPMLKRVARKGHNRGNEFWGCSRFPDCRGIRSIQAALDQ